MALKEEDWVTDNMAIVAFMTDSDDIHLKGIVK
jgi:hypothetical protein